jgi:hypothetical protein
VRTTFGPERLTVLDVRISSGLQVFRIVRSEVEDDPALENSFRSHYELAWKPRGPERSSAVLHMGISVHVNSADAEGTARRFRKIGGYVAQLVLRPGNGFNYAHTAQPGHLTVWGDPLKLCASIDRIRPVAH